MEEIFDDYPSLLNEENPFWLEPTDDPSDSIFGSEAFPGFQSPQFISESPQPLTTPPKAAPVTQRRTKKDDFDYKTYISQQLQEQELESLDPAVKKRMIQKIRNRVSAERSRKRQKSALDGLQQENAELRGYIDHLLQQVSALKLENGQLREKVTALEASKASESTSLAEDQASFFSSEGLRRETSPTGQKLSKGLVLLAITAIACFVLPPAARDNSVIKASGIVPLIGTKLVAVSERQLQTLEDQCQKYCPTCPPTPSDFGFRDRGLMPYGEQNRLLEIYRHGPLSALVCVDPLSKQGIQETFKVLVDGQTRSALEPQGLYVANLQKVSIEGLKIAN